MLRKGAKGDDVRDLQIKLMTLGYALPRWGADGDLGDETLGALALFMYEHKGANPDDRADVVSNNELMRVDDAMAGRLTELGWPDIPVTDYFDRKKFASMKADFGQRPWSQITAICLHQTACLLGEKPERMDTVGAHGVVTRGGRFIELHAPNRLIAHGNGLNARSIGLEMDGLYSEFKGGPAWNDPTTSVVERAMTPTAQLISTSIAVCLWYADVVASHGGKIKFILMHRQSSGSRENDPGEELCKAVAIPVCEALGATMGEPGFKIGSGNPIPARWLD